MSEQDDAQPEQPEPERRDAPPDDPSPPPPEPAFGVWLREQRQLLRVARDALVPAAGVLYHRIQSIELGRAEATDAERRRLSDAVAKLRGGR